VADLFDFRWPIFLRASTSPDLQAELANLPAVPTCNFDGYLQDLAKRPDRISNVNVTSLNTISRGNFAITSIFNVENDSGQMFTYEYVSWRYGPSSGAKGLVLVEKDGAPTHFIVLAGEKFATGKREADCVGGFMDIGVDGVTSILGRIKREITEELGLTEIQLTREPIDLGSLCMDPGMTNNRPNIFIAHIDANQAEKIPAVPQNSDPYELKASVIVYPIEKLKEVVLLTQDTYFQQHHYLSFRSQVRTIPRILLHLHRIQFIQKHYI
jgi:hypothetical protein